MTFCPGCAAPFQLKDEEAVPLRMACGHYMCTGCVMVQTLSDVTTCGVCESNMLPYTPDYAFGQYCQDAYVIPQDGGDDTVTNQAATTFTPPALSPHALETLLQKLRATRARLVQLRHTRVNVQARLNADVARFWAAKAEHEAAYAAKDAALNAEIEEIQRTRTDGSTYIRKKFPGPEERDAEFAEIVSTVEVALDAV
jgi:hypothetical protein